MRHLNSFIVFERKKDISLISSIRKLYKDVFENLHTKCKKNEFIYIQDKFYVFLMDFYIPMVISFDRNRRHASFGKIQINNGDSLPCLYLMYKEYNVETNFSLLMNYSSKESDVIHELTHLVDVINSGDFRSIPMNKLQTEWDSIDIKQYYNHAYERNAYFIESCSKVYKYIEDNIEILDSFDVFLTYMKLGSMGNAYSNMTDKNKKKFVSRCYMLYDILTSNI